MKNNNQKKRLKEEEEKEKKEEEAAPPTPSTTIRLNIKKDSDVQYIVIGRLINMNNSLLSRRKISSIGRYTNETTPLRT